MEYDADRVCMGCRMAGQKTAVSGEDWDARKQQLTDLIEQTRCPDASRHDCVIPVSGGKDSFWQIHLSEIMEDHIKPITKPDDICNI